MYTLESFWETYTFEIAAVRKRASSDPLQRTFFFENDFCQTPTFFKNTSLQLLNRPRNDYLFYRTVLEAAPANNL